MLARAYGLADRDGGRPNTPDTRFQAASVAKGFTAAAVARLVAAGKLAFETRLADLPGLRFPAYDPGIRLEHLLSHTAGIVDYFDEAGGEDYASIWERTPASAMRTPEDFLPLFVDRGMAFPPGARFAYNNAGFILLGLVVERVGGRPFAVFVEEEVFAPAGMTGSGYPANDPVPPDAAVAYMVDRATGAARSNVGAVPLVGGPDGGVYTTTADLGRFWRALASGRLLGEAVTARMLAPRVAVEGEAPATHYGLGFWLVAPGGRVERAFLTGWDPGVAALSTAAPDGDPVITLLANRPARLWPVHDLLRRATGA